LQALNDMIATLRQLGGPRLVEEVAKEAAPLVDEATKITARAGTSTEGASWPARKKDGARALANVEGAISTVAVGAVVRQTLTGGAVYSHFGAHGPKRAVIPEGGGSIPPQVTAALTQAATRVFNRAIAQGGSQ
jgi:hypothetical protein